MKTTTNPKDILSKKKDHKDLTNKGKSTCFKLVVAGKFNLYELSIIKVFRKQKKKDTIA